MNKIEYELDTYRSIVLGLRELANAMASTIRYNTPYDLNSFKDFDTLPPSTKAMTFHRLDKHAKMLELNITKIKNLKQFMGSKKIDFQ